MQELDPVVASNHSSELESANTNTGPRLSVDAAESFNYAAWQNAVPLLRSIEIENVDGPELSSLTVELNASSGFVRGKVWTVDRIGPGETLRLKNVDLDVDPAYLDHLDEAERGVLTLRLRHKDELLHQHDHVLRVLARDEWGGMSDMGELLPAFVTPNDPSLAVTLRTAATLLGQHGHSTALDGYQSRDPNRAYLLAASLWSAIGGQSLIYANPPGSFERTGQKTRRVATILNDRLATCLDTSLLFASGLEAIGLNPVLIMTKGHCFAGVWLVEKCFQRPVESDCSEVRKAIAAKELIVFETTLVTHFPPAQFPAAVTTAAAAVSVDKEDDFTAAIDIKRGRMSNVRPLASHVQREGAAPEGEDAGSLPLPAAPGYQAVSSEDVEETPRTPAGRIERWQRKLLDLSLRNRLLNFRPSRQTIPVLCPDVSKLEDRLADGTKLRLISLSDGNPLGRRDAELHQRRTQKDLDWEFARQALDRNEISCTIEKRDLEYRLTALYRKIRNDMAEGGSNTLFLAVGFLRWKTSPTDQVSYRAPLLLVPVTLTRRSASSPYYLASHDDDVRFNATLIQLLKKDFACDLSYFESDLPTDDSGVNVPLVFERMRQAVREMPGFEVLEEAAISPFSFAKYLMWKDLVDRVGELEHNRVVRHLIRDPDKPFPTDHVGPIPQPREIDRRYAPHEIVHPLPADSSQLAAVMAASEGHDLVIVGPPGTGKSQTIANLIAQCLSVGKTVLFVAEKTAALDVVHRRLREHGLGDCCIELHSNKAERRRFLDQLESSWKKQSHKDSLDWLEISHELRVRRDHLNQYVAAIHTAEPNGWTPYRAMGLCVRDRDVATPRLNWPATLQHNQQQYADLRETVFQLARISSAVTATAKLPHVRTTEWSMSWESQFLETCRKLREAAEVLTAALRPFAELLAAPELRDVSSAQLRLVYRLAYELSRASLPARDILMRARSEELKTAMAMRRELLNRSQQACQSQESALREFGQRMGVSAPPTVCEAWQHSLFQLAGELDRANLPPAELVFHEQLDAVAHALAEQPALLQARERAVQAVTARSFSSALIDHIPVEVLEKQWQKAATSFWPLSMLRRNQTRKQFKAYLSAGGVAEPDVDLPLLHEYKACCDRIAENLASTGLSEPLLAKVRQNSNALDDSLALALTLQQAIQATGLSPASAGRATKGQLKPLIDAARRLQRSQQDRKSIDKQLDENLAGLGLPEHLLEKVKQDASALDSEIALAIGIRDAAAAIGFLGDRLAQVLNALMETPEQRVREVTTKFCHSAKNFQQAWSEYAHQAATTPAVGDSVSVIADVSATAQQILGHRTALKPWTAWMAIQKKARKLGLEPFVDGLECGELESTDLVDQFELAYARWWLPIVIDQRETLRAFQRFQHELSIEDFRRLDEQARQAAAPQVCRTIFHGLPAGDQVPRKSELGLLRHQMGLKRPSKSIREIISGMPDTFDKLAPCLLMSPLSIAQYLPAHQKPFDVVVFDEASQIATWDAIGAIARGKQTIIVGDPKQLPPTNFFGRAESDEDNAEVEDHDKDLESILDEAQASGLPTLQLNWHYRSRHESLIAFSNWNYYGNHLVTFPAAESEDRGVSFKHIQDGRYDRGKSRTNRQEAEAIVSDLVQRMKRCFAKPVEQRLTYGVVTFNSQQQELIQDLLDDALRKHQELEWFFADERFEPTAVKNLENVQGDERDVMLFSITFGFDPAGKFSVDFGAINRDGGERRLNVAVTRARQELIVYASFLPEQLRSERSNARGVHDLKAFLEYAEKGPQVLAARIHGSQGELESPLEEAVAKELEKRGWRLDSQVGVSEFRIDLGIVHPDKPGTYLAGVECDGATYHRSAIARDRDKNRQLVLEQLGWTIVRVWSPDWWYDPHIAIERLHSRLEELLTQSRAQSMTDISSESPDQATLESDIDDDSSIVFEEYLGDPAALESLAEASPCDEPKTEGSDSLPQLVASQAPQQRVLYVRATLGDATANQHRFFEDDYTDTLKDMALSVLVAQGPILDDALAREIARVHGFARTGNRIKQRILELLPNVTSTNESVGKFLWPGPSATDYIPFRHASHDDDRRHIDEIPMPELVGLVREQSSISHSDDPALFLAREIGLTRLSRTARERLEAALENGSAIQ